MNAPSANASANASGPFNFLFGKKKSNNSANSANSANSLNSTNVTRKNSPNSPMAGGSKAPRVGSRVQVYHGHAHHTSGGLTRKDLFLNKRGRIVSRKASAAGKKALKRLHKAGYVAKRGTFKLFKRK